MPRWFVQILGLAVLCTVTGWVAQFTAQSTASGPNVWPPVGIGLVAVLVFGNRMTLGVWLSLFYLSALDTERLGNDIRFVTVTLSAAGLASVYSLQALFGAWCIRKALGGSVALLRVRDIAVFLIVAGPGHTLLAPILRAVGLCYFQTHTWDNFFTDWLSGFSSDTLGGIFFAPLTLTLIGQPRDVWSKRIGTVGVPVIVAMALTAVGFLVARSWEEKTTENRFRQEIESSVREIRSEAREVEQALIRFQSISQSELLDSTYDKSSVRGNLKHLREYIPWTVTATALAVIHQKDRANFESVRRRDAAPIAIVETGPNGQTIPAGNREQYIVVVCSSPRIDGVPTGYDLAEQPQWKPLLEQATQTGEIAVSPVDFSANRPRIRMVTPCFRMMNTKNSIPIRTGKPIVYGYIAVEIDPSLLIEDLRKAVGNHITIRLSKPDSPIALPASSSRLTERFGIAGQSLQLEATASATFLNSSYPSKE